MSNATTHCAKPGRRAMRHNPAAGAVVIMLRSLKMHGMAQAVGELTEQGSPAFEAALPILSQLLKRRPTGRSDRRPTSSRRPVSQTIATLPASTSPVAKSTRRSHRRHGTLLLINLHSLWVASSEH